MVNKRIVFLFLTIFSIIIEVLIAIYVHDSFVRPYLGDVLVVICIYFFIKIFFLKPRLWLPFAIFIFASLVEVLQFFNLSESFNINIPILRIALGSTFDLIDIVCYATGCIFIGIFEYFDRKIAMGK